MTDPTWDDDARTPEQREADSRKATQDRAFRVNLMHVLASEAGQDVIWWILDMCDPMDVPDSHGAELERALGRKVLGVELMRVIGQLDGRLLGKMIERRFTARLREANA